MSKTETELMPKDPENTSKLAHPDASCSPLRHLDLFSGIGGFALAARMAGGFETVGFCEIDPWARKVLAKNFPGVPIHDDVKTLKGNEYGTIDLITGGFPCQPYSTAGKQKGSKDERDCLPDMLRLIEECRPRWVLCENSPNVLRMAFNQIKTYLEAEAYQVGEPFIIPACAVNADHRRDRAWVCAYTDTQQLQRGSEKEVSRVAGLPEQFTRVFESDRSRRSLSRPGMLRSFNGLSKGVDRIKGLGNAIVPQVAAEILRCIIKADNFHQEINA